MEVNFNEIMAILQGGEFKECFFKQREAYMTITNQNPISGEIYFTKLSEPKNYTYSDSVMKIDNDEYYFYFRPDSISLLKKDEYIWKPDWVIHFSMLRYFLESFETRKKFCYLHSPSTPYLKYDNERQIIKSCGETFEGRVVLILEHDVYFVSNGQLYCDYYRIKIDNLIRDNFIRYNQENLPKVILEKDDDVTKRTVFFNDCEKEITIKFLKSFRSPLLDELLKNEDEIFIPVNSEDFNYQNIELLNYLCSPLYSRMKFQQLQKLIPEIINDLSASNCEFEPLFK